jgi:hypothetical protein
LYLFGFVFSLYLGEKRYTREQINGFERLPWLVVIIMGPESEEKNKTRSVIISQSTERGGGKSFFQSHEARRKNTGKNSSE